MPVEAVKIEATTSSGTRIRVPVLLEKKECRGPALTPPFFLNLISQPSCWGGMILWRT